MATKPVQLDHNLPSRKTLERSAWNMFVKKLIRASSPKEIEEILASFLTAQERKEIGVRVAAAMLLREGKSYRRIGDALWLSPSTISAIQKSLRGGKEYVPRHVWWKTEKRKKRDYAPIPRKPDTIIIAPHGKRAFPRRVRAR